MGGLAQESKDKDELEGFGCHPVEPVVPFSSVVGCPLSVEHSSFFVMRLLLPPAYFIQPEVLGSEAV